MFNGDFNRRKLVIVLVLFSMYLLLSLPHAMAFQCEQYEAEKKAGGTPIIEHCSKPAMIQGKKVFFLYAYTADKSSIELKLYSDKNSKTPASCSALDPMQSGGAELSISENEVTVQKDGAYALVCSDDRLEIESETEGVMLYPHENCDQLVVDRSVSEQYLDYIAFQKAKKDMTLDIKEMNASADYLKETLAATGMGVGAAASMTCGGPDGGSVEPPEAAVCSGCEGGRDFPSFKILDPTYDQIKKYSLGKETYKEEGGITQNIKQLVEIKKGPLSGQRFILRTEFRVINDYMSYKHYLSEIGGPDIGSVYYDYRANLGEIKNLHIHNDPYKGKGLARLFNELYITNMIAQGAETLRTNQMMAIGNDIPTQANPYVAKTYKNLKFGPRMDMAPILANAPFTEPAVKPKHIMYSKYGHPFVHLVLDKGTDYLLFITDSEGNIIFEKEFYEQNLLGKSKQEVRQFLLEMENQGRTLWGWVDYEAKDFPYLEENIVREVKVPDCVCSFTGTRAYYPAAGGDIGIFKDFSNLDSAIFVDRIYTNAESIEMWVLAHATRNDMEISNLKVVRTGPDKHLAVFNYAGKERQIIMYSRNANTFFPPELSEGYDLYYEKLFRGTGESQVLYDMSAEMKTKVLDNLNTGGKYAVFSRWDYSSYKQERLPSLLGLEEITREGKADGWYGHFLEKTSESNIDPDLRSRILRHIYPKAEQAYEARLGRAADTVEGNMEAFKQSLMEMEQPLKDQFSSEERSWIMDRLEREFLGDGAPLREEVRLPPMAEDLRLESRTKFCNFQERMGGSSACSGGGCARMPEPLTRESYNVYDSEGNLKGNLITETEKVLDEVETRMRSENIKGRVAVKYFGSSTYMYDSTSGTPRITFEHISDLDYAIYFSDEVPESEYGRIKNWVESRLVDRTDMLFGENKMDLSLFAEASYREITDPMEPAYFHYEQKSVFVSSSEFLSDIDTLMREAENMDRMTLLKMKKESLTETLNTAKKLAHIQDEYAKGVKRLALASHVLGNTELTSEIISEYKANYPNLEPTFDKYASRLTEEIKIMDTAVLVQKSRYRIRTYSELNKLIRDIRENYYLEDNLDTRKVNELETRLVGIKERLRQRLPEPADRKNLNTFIEHRLRPFIRYLKNNPSLTENVAKERATQFNTLLEKFRNLCYDDYYRMCEKGQLVREAFEEIGVERTREMKAAQRVWYDAIIENQEAAKKLEKWHLSKYNKQYVKEARGESFKRLKAIGKSKYVKYGELPSFVVGVLGAEFGQRLVETGYYENDPYLTKIGWYIHMGSYVLILPFAATLLFSLVKAVITLSASALMQVVAAVIVCAVAIKLIVEAADWLICEQSWSKEVSIGTYSVYGMFCGGKTEIKPEINIQLADDSGVQICQHAGAWEGQRHLTCSPG